MTTITRQQAGRPTGGQFAARTRSDADTTLSAETDINDTVDDWFAGSAKDLNAAQAGAIVALNAHFGFKPSVTVDDPETRVDLIYAPAEDFDGFCTTRVTIGGDGSVQAFGHGEDWEYDSIDDDRQEKLEQVVAEQVRDWHSASRSGYAEAGEKKSDD